MTVAEGRYNSVVTEKYAALRRAAALQKSLLALEAFLKDNHPEVLEEFLDIIHKEEK